MAPPLDAMVLALGRLCGVAGTAGADASEGALRLPKSKKLVSTPFLSRKALRSTNCDLIVSLSTLVCCAMVAPPRKRMPDSMPASTRPTTVSRSECGSLTTRPSILAIAVRATPSSTPAKIRNRVAAKYQVNSKQRREQHDADAADRYRPRQIVAGQKTIVSRTCHVDSFPQNIPGASLSRKFAPGSSGEARAGLTLACPVCQAVQATKAFPAKWTPVRVKKTRQSRIGAPFQFHRNGKGSSDGASARMR